MTEKEYNEAPGIRRSALWRMSESPEKYKYFLEHPPEPTPALIFGSAVHKLLLEPVDFEEEYAVAPPVDRRTKAGKETWEQFVAGIGEKTVITQDDFDTMAAMVEKANSVPFVKNLLQGKHEVPLFWTDDDTGLDCKVRLDILAEIDGKFVVADYKTANNASTDVFVKKIYDLGYHLQAYMYTEALRINMNLDYRPDFYFIAQEKKPPYAVNYIITPYEIMLDGMDDFRHFIGTLRDCIGTGYYYGFNGPFDEPNEAYRPAYKQIGDEE